MMRRKSLKVSPVAAPVSAPSAAWTSDSTAEAISAHPGHVQLLELGEKWLLSHPVAGFPLQLTESLCRR